MSIQKLKNIPHKLRRELYRIPALNAMKEQAHQRAIDSHAQLLPLLNKQERAIVKRLKQEGTCIISLDELKLSTTEHMITTAHHLASKLNQPQLNKLQKCEVEADKNDFREFPKILLWALEPKLLNIFISCASVFTASGSNEDG